MRERDRQVIINKAVAAAEEIILAETDGSEETLLWLTVEMARRYQDKISIMVNHILNRKEFRAERDHERP